MSIRINGIDYNSTINENSTIAHGTYHLADNPNLFEIQRSNNFEFVITDLDGIVKPYQNDNSSIDNAQEILRLSVSSTSVPHFQQSVIETKRGNNTLKYAGVPTFDAGQIVINDYIGADSKAVLMAWQNLSYNVVTEKVGLASDYKKDCTLIEYSPDYQLVRTWKMHGCWISNITEGAFSSDGNDKRQITATIQYDRAEVNAKDDM